MQLFRARASVLLLAMALLAGAPACGDDGPDPAIRATVTRWLDAWSRASGPPREDVAATAARRELGGELLARTEDAAGGLAREPRARVLARLYNEFVGVAIPPDRGFEVLTVDLRGDSARVAVRLVYSQAAAGAAAAAGLLPFAQVARVSGLAAQSPEPVFTVTRIEGEWRITAIRPR